MTDVTVTDTGNLRRVEFSRALAVHQHRPVTNIGELMASLAMDWTEDVHTRRKLIAGGYPREQFIRAPGPMPYPRLKKHAEDIPVVTAPYSLAGFLQFEAASMFRGLFEVTSERDDGTGESWWFGSLTAMGFEIASASLLEFDMSTADVQRVAFFNPSVRRLVDDLALGLSPRSIR